MRASESYPHDRSDGLEVFTQSVLFAQSRFARTHHSGAGPGGGRYYVRQWHRLVEWGGLFLRSSRFRSTYGAEVHHFGPTAIRWTSFVLPEVDFAALGRAVGLQATIRRVQDLAVVADRAHSGGTPGLVLDAKVVPTVVETELEEAFGGH